MPLVIAVLFWILMAVLIVASFALWLWWNGPLLCLHFGKMC